MSFPEHVYHSIREGSQRSAAVCVPMILNALPIAAGERVRCIDVGCGEGWWTEALYDAGASEVLPVDHPVPETHAAGTRDVDLEASYELPRGHDLALCLEVAEHLTAPAGDELVRQLTRSARTIAWSAAIPGQGGSGHLNEQWPAYWEERFNEHGFAFIDPFRDALWGHPEVEPWYQQNLLLAVPARAAQQVRPLVHPVIFEARVAERDRWLLIADDQAGEIGRLQKRIGNAHRDGWREVQEP